ncbi:MAG: ATP-dependent sacrificial sulfur transferase LarE [Peptostreptococcaceae bacterium]|nr:ATP-dependent sacrificial sulfur transferase LarE [Peptostreptococcaceae bacterium]
MLENNILLKKIENLKKYLNNHKKFVIAFSGGVDSSFLSKIASVSNCKFIAITIKSPFIKAQELEESIEFCKELNIKHHIIDVDIMSNNEILSNKKDRCYTCKKEIFNHIINFCKKNNIDIIMDGSNFDDLKDYRPGMKALDELNIKSPLKELEFTKNEIRSGLKYFNLKEYKKPSAACLASRIPYDEIITLDKLKIIEESEKLISNLGFKVVRVRLHDSNLARIEIGYNEFDKILDKEILNKIQSDLKKLDIKHITLDLAGYKMGSLN